MSEKELAARLGVAKSYLNSLSCGRKNATIRQLERIADALELTLHIGFE